MYGYIDIEQRLLGKLWIRVHVQVCEVFAEARQISNKGWGRCRYHLERVSILARFGGPLMIVMTHSGKEEWLSQGSARPFDGMRL